MFPPFGLKCAQKLLQQTTASTRLDLTIQHHNASAAPCLPRMPILEGLQRGDPHFLSPSKPTPYPCTDACRPPSGHVACRHEASVLFKMTLQGHAKFGLASSTCEGHEEHDICARNGGSVSLSLPPVISQDGLRCFETQSRHAHVKHCASCKRKGPMRTGSGLCLEDKWIHLD